MPSACHHRLAVTTTAAMSVHDLTAQLQALIDAAGIREGLLTAVGQHTTTALVINEAEERLWHDIEHFFTALVPADRPWRHNDLHLRDVPPDEPRNAHAHLIALMLGNQLCVPIVAGRLGLGRYQALLLVELDGPRQRDVLVRIAADT
jgi:secondary thiamine-phosphate synthase enzyme